MSNWHLGLISAPWWLWLSCLGLILYFGYSFQKLRSEAKVIIRRFRDLTNELQSIQPENKPIDGHGLDQLRTIMHADEVLSECWDEFEETLLFDEASNSDDSGAVYNTRQADEFFKGSSRI